ncbi:TetR/AcrR family transcriptional regulator [Raineyella fluvialis]|uniref:TetR family transcriptional regulator n=1 Tax=Raineyella fluvialis TaxID=2662261 RepID=A0A5Q2FHP4_9ACTN|nr:TetR/AcrR family transcriptional regulator [Raineyella fluvialis]QGF24673.1 TetR family transcriptional regulator [Raineyella fluvialis]
MLPRQSSTLRQAQAALTRSRIADAARTLFLDAGYVATSVSAIAAAAGVSVQTIYNVVGNKAAVLSAVLDLVAAGPESPRLVPEFLEERSRHAPDVPAMVDLLVEWFIDVHPRTASLWAVIRQAAAVDEEVADLERRRADRRLSNYVGAAARARELGGLTSSVTDEEAAAAIWALGHPDAYRALVLVRGWTLDAYGTWLRYGLTALLG